MPHFTREPVLHALTRATLRPRVEQLIFADGAAVVGGVTTTALPASFFPNGVFDIELNGNRQVFVGVFIEALGGDVLTGVTLRIEMRDPLTGLWIPSAEGVPRTADAASHNISLIGVGNHLVATRKEHRRFSAARVLFQAAAGAADEDTIIRAVWYPDSSSASAY